MSSERLFKKSNQNSKNSKNDSFSGENLRVSTFVEDNFSSPRKNLCHQIKIRVDKKVSDVTRNLFLTTFNNEED